MASKHGNDLVKIWDTQSQALQGVVKVPSYTEAQTRSRDYLIRSHAVLSATAHLVAVATRFGRTLEIWNWATMKCLHTIGETDRWSVGRAQMHAAASGWLAVYRTVTHSIRFYSVDTGARRLVEEHAIDLSQAGLPFVPQFPELAFSPNSSLFVLAAGPRPPLPGHSLPAKETLLVAWDIKAGYLSTKPLRVVQPWQHEEITTAVPCQLAAFDQVVVSIWIPASYRTASATSLATVPYRLVHTAVLSRYVLVWDLATSCTWTFAIPNCTACISPDCRFVAYCHASGAEIGARGCLTILNVNDGREVWSWPDKDALAINSGPRPGFEQFEDLGGVTELAFTTDGRALVVGDRSGRIVFYNIT